METAWLIEFKQSASQRPAWYGADDTEGLGMVTNANDAIRFSRKIDAEKVIEGIGWTEAFAVEHVWMGGARRPRLRTNNPLPFSVVRPDGSKPD